MTDSTKTPLDTKEPVWLADLVPYVLAGIMSRYEAHIANSKKHDDVPEESPPE